MQPFLDVLRSHPSVGAALADASTSQDPDERIPIELAHSALLDAVRMTGDPDLGLKAARRAAFGDAGALDYLVCSGATVMEAVQVAAKHTRLVNDALTLELAVEGKNACIRLTSTVALPRAACDFLIAGLFRNYCRVWFDGVMPEVVVMFRHSAPASTSEYQDTFEPATVGFSGTCDGFIFPAQQLKARLRSADSRLHQVLQRHAENVLASLPELQSSTSNVKALIISELERGSASATYIAGKLGISSRTLGRRLELEGTTFKTLLDDVRKQLALEMVGLRDQPFSEIAAALGFSQPAAFHRAFRRWTATTPLQYRRQRLR
ncbi:MAG TPA: AraC family transcriptional regulator ligand-binding domain-containing protein [Polyangiaceae bacterium]|nr:AraC family transcriptional regulator ligand-binding domain-containing protein [Polyangiaceae bacterium]